MNRNFRFNPLDRTGMFFGLEAVQLAIVGASILFASVLASASLILAVIPILLAATWCILPVGGMRLYEFAPILRRYLVRQVSGETKWRAKLPPVGSHSHSGELPQMPPFLSEIEIIDAEAPWAHRSDGRVGIAFDKRVNMMTVAIPVVGREFTLVSVGEQSRLIDGWGEAIAPFCRERSPVTRIGWTEWAAPSGIDEHLSYLDEAATAARNSISYQSYLELLETAGPMVTTHETLVTISVDLGLVRPVHKIGETIYQAGIRSALEDSRLLANRLEGANLQVGDPLSAHALRRALRVRMDPAEAFKMRARQRAIGVEAPLVSNHNYGPLAVEESWKHIRVDGSYHRSYWFYEWPRLEVPASWMSAILLGHEAIRTITMVYEPVSMRHSQRAIDRAATKITADTQAREKHGFRVNANFDRAQKAVLDREQEIIAGYTEFEYCALVTITAESEDELEIRGSEIEQTASSIGIDLRPLDGRQAQAWAASLPLGRNLAGRISVW